MRAGVRSTNGVFSRRTAIFAVFATAYFLSQFYRSTNAVIAKDLIRDLDLSAADLGLMTSLFYASFAAAQLPLGLGLDRFGPRYVTPGLMLVGALGSLAFGSAHSFAALALGRALIGVGMAGVYMGALKIFSRWFSVRKFASASGYLVGIGALGALGAATPLAWLNQAFGWRSVFLAGSLVTVASAASIFAWARNAPPGTDRPGDGRGGGYTEVFRDLRFWRIASLDFFLVGTLLSVQGLWGGPFLYDVLRLPQIEAGNVLVSLSAGALVGYLLSGWLAERFSEPKVLIAAAGLFVAAQSAVVLGGFAGVAWVVRAAYPLFGLGGAANILLMAHVRSVFPTSMTGRAVTAVNLFGIGGSALLQWAMGLIVNAFGRDLQGHYPVEAYAAAFALTICGGLAALLFYAPLVRERASAVSGPGIETAA